MKRIDPPFIRSTIKPGYRLSLKKDNRGNYQRILEFDNETYETWLVLVFQGIHGDEICPRDIKPKDWHPKFIVRENGQTSVDPKDQNWRTATSEEIEYLAKCLERGEYEKLEEYKEKLPSFSEKRTSKAIKISTSIVEKTPDNRIFKRILYNEDWLEYPPEDKIVDLEKREGREIKITKEEFLRDKNKIWCKLGEW
jgi:hypothetical protein